MKSFMLSTLALLASNAVTCLAHWNYDRLIVNGEIIGSSYQYVRRTNNSNSPIQNVNSTEMRCNAGGWASAANTSTYTVHAGDTVGFTIASTFGHPGPQQVYLSKAPSTAREYDGSGEWARIYAASWSNLSSTEGLNWATHKIHSFLFTLPTSTPAGEYLLRAEGIALHAAHKPNCTQFYIGCAQINVVNNEAETKEWDEAEKVDFPGGYQWDTPGVLIPVFWTKLSNYTTPGPPLWPKGKEVRVVKTLPGLG